MAGRKKNDFLLKAIQEPNRSQSILALPMMKVHYKQQKYHMSEKKAETHQGCIHNYTFKSSTCTYHKCNNLT